MYKYLLAIGLFIIQNSLAAQQLLNGGFEGSGVACGLNLSNQEFSSKMPQVLAFGEQNQPSILSASCNLGSAQQGTHFVGLTAKAGITDAIGIRLSEPLIPGQFYTLEFYEKIGRVVNGPARLSVGIANSPTSHGELLHTVFELNPNWTRHSFAFRPPINGTYITVIVETGGEALVFVDNFSLICPQVFLGKDTTYCEVQDVTLKANGMFESYRWSNESTDATLTINKPGTYWIEAKQGACIARDTIAIFENRFICDCKIFLPNVFSPNEDGINDTWHPITPCELMDYELQIFDRWGNLVFQGNTSKNAWDGHSNQKNQPSGVYAYQLRYRFAPDPETLHRAEGLITLIR